MRQENYRNKTKINMMTTALLGIFFYVLLVIILKTIQNWIPIGTTGMKIFNIIEFAVAAIYLVLYTWGNFKNATQENGSTFGKYLLLIMIPLIVLTLATIIVSFTAGNSTFGGKWNVVTFIVGPTVFCYIPFNIILQFVSQMPMILFYVIALGLMVLFQFLGFVLGSGSRKFSRERELVRAEQDRRMMQRQDEMARQVMQERRNQAVKAASVQKTYVMDERDPFKDLESKAVVETEAFTSITDEMIEEAIRNNKIKTTQRRNNSGRTEKVSEAQNITVRQETSKEKSQQGAQNQRRVQSAQNVQTRQNNRDIQKELEYLRKRLEKEDHNRK